MTDMEEWLAKSTGWRCASLMFSSPTAQALAELTQCAAILPPRAGEVVRQFASLPYPDWEAEFHRVLGPAGCAAGESSFEENALAGRGPVIARIAGYYRAFSYLPDPAITETPDHISVELGFLSYLALKIAFAGHAGRGEELEIARSAYEKFLREHPGFWLDKFQRQLAEYQSTAFDTAVAFVRELFRNSSG